jgi:uncharacterized protein YdeI (YjbR/CyaY-like superfamily)
MKPKKYRIRKAANTLQYNKRKEADGLVRIFKFVTPDEKEKLLTYLEDMRNENNRTQEIEEIRNEIENIKKQGD